MLFRLVNDGYPPETLGPDGTATEPPDDGGGLRFEALRADLFSPSATALIDEVGLGDGCLQDVLARLLLTKKQRNKARGFVSYAQLGINQLGAVYEGLMSYTGSIAGDHMVEVAKDGDPAKGSWVVPEASTRDFDPKWFVERKNPETGVSERVALRAGRLRLPALGPRPAAQRLVLHARGADPLRGHALPRRAAHRRHRRPRRCSTCGSASRPWAPGRSSSRRSTSSPTQYLTRRQKELGRRIDPEAVRGGAAEGQGVPRPAQLLRRRPQRHRRRAGRDHAVARRHAPRPARPVVRPAPAPRQLADRRPPRDLDARRSWPSAAG